ncbi:MAG TPA: hypothetical protein VJX31_10780, partial [Casimicrobiaceae bacterium]|nr:hypothetical protein [Casimicrobiaceae bacterium]
AENSAPYGAGAAVLGTEHGTGYLGVFSTNPASPGAIYENVASRTGGGVFIKPGSRHDASFCAQDFDIHANTAVNGAAIYADLDDDRGSDVLINSIDPLVVCSLDAIACEPGPSCNRIDDNVATDGAIMLVQSNGTFSANRFSMRGNQAATMIGELTDAGTQVKLWNCLLAGNSVVGALIDAYTPGDLDIASTLSVDGCTFAGNAIGAPDVVHGQVSGFALTDSIVYQPGKGTIDGPVFTPFVHYVLSNDVSTLPAGEDVVQGVPTFVDAAAGDYHLQPTSLGVDFAPVPIRVPPQLDLDGLPRAVDLVAIANLFGSLDLGPYEIQEGGVIDPIFTSYFE